MFDRFKALAERRKQVTDADLEVLVGEDVVQGEQPFVLEGLHVGCGTLGMPTATVRLRAPDGALRVQASVGTGPVDATYKAIDALVSAPATLLEYSVHSVTEGIDALGHVTVRVRDGDERARVWSGTAADTDIIVASAKAYLRALNRILVARPQARAHAQAS